MTPPTRCSRPCRHSSCVGSSSTGWRPSADTTSGSTVPQALDTDVVMVYRPSAWGTVDPEVVTADGLHPVELEPTQLECLQGLEQRVGGVMVAYRRDAD